MTRLIPGKAKVNIELFRGVTLGDIFVAGVAAAMLILVLISNLPYRFAICIGVGCVAGLLLFRIDDQANYRYLLHILAYLGYDHRFSRIYTDKMLVEREEGKAEEAAFDEVFRKETEKIETRSEKKQRLKAMRAAKKERKAKREEENKLLRSKHVSEEEREAIRARRAAESEAATRSLAEEKDASATRKSMDAITGFTAIRDGLIEYGKGAYYGAAIEIDPVEFRFFSEYRRQNSIENGLGRILRAVNAKYSANIVKIERPIRYDSYLEAEYGKLFQLRTSYENGMLTEEELKARVEIEYDRINELQSLCTGEKVVTGFYYLVLYESDRRQLELQIANALSSLRQGEMTARRLGDKELAVFLKYSNALDFDEHEIEKIAQTDYARWAQPEVVDFKARRVEVNHIVTHNFRVTGYPTLVGDAWLAGVMSIPGTKVVVKAKPIDRIKATRAIDHSLIELRGQWSATGVDSRRMEIEQHLSTLQELLGTLQADNETLLECNVYITAYDIVGTRNDYKIKQPGESILPTIADMKKTVRRSWQESGFRLNSMEFEQVQAFIGSQVSGLDPLAPFGRGIPSNTIAASYPWIFAHISDEGGVKLGTNDGIPVFINFFRRDSERVNSNMVIVGKSGSGKSYATKTILSNLAADDAKIFVLDPENEYTELAGNLHGKIINVGNAQYGRLNPFHIITALDDDEAGDGAPSGSYATHLQFLEEFFRQILPDCDKDSMEYLNTLLDRLYGDFNITAETDLSRLRPEDYPVFDDLYDAILQEFQSTDNDYIHTMLRTLLNYVAKFSTGGRNANIWNGPSTVTTDTNFTVFNFQSMLANRNQTVANAQMLLVLKYIDNEIIKNRDYNTKYGLHRKVVVVIDEAHVFIDTKYPIALDFMFQLAKRIRKYNGMQIVITQNIKDFVGSEEIARKSTAIINACQYSFIFALAPNDMQDLVKLYENAGGINESEQEQIVQAPRGQAFTVMSPTSRSTFRVETSESVAHMFEDRGFVSQYFSGERGAANWEDYVAGSRNAHDEAAMSRWEQERVEEKPVGEAGQGITFRELDVEEENAGSEAGGISFREEDASYDAQADEAAAYVGARQAAGLASAVTPETKGAGQSTAMDAMVEMFGAMTEAFKRVGVSAVPAEASGADVEMPQLARTEADPVSELMERLTAKDAELDRMRLELERLRQSVAQEAADSIGASPTEDNRDQDASPTEDDWEDQDVFPAEDYWEDQDVSPAEDYWEDESGPAFAINWDAIGTGFEEAGSEDGIDGEAPDEEQDSISSELAAYVRASAQAAQSQTVVDRMRREGLETMEINHSDLKDYLNKRKQETTEVA